MNQFYNQENEEVSIFEFISNLSLNAIFFEEIVDF